MTRAKLSLLICMLLITHAPVDAADQSSKPANQTQSKNAKSNGRKSAAKKHKALTEKDALAAIENLSEVREFRQGVLATKGKATPVVEVDRKEGNEYIIHVYEIVPDDAETSHTATFNWYYVNIKSGKIRKDF